MTHRNMIAAKRVLERDGWTRAEITALVNDLRADAWNKGADSGRRVADKDPTMNLFVFDDNPYRKRP